MEKGVAYGLSFFSGGAASKALTVLPPPLTLP
jgi:hypothetical protein